MLYIPHQPIKVKVTDDRKIIILTKSKIMFSTFDFIEQFLSMPLVGGQPKTFYYAPQTLEVLVQTENTLQIFYCDWRTQIKLKKVIILNNQPVYSIYYEKKVGWNVVGNILQYQQPKMVFHQPKQHFSSVICKCFVEKSQYTLTESGLYKSQGNDNPMEVSWKSLKMVLKNFKNCIKMEGSPTVDKQRHVLCLNSIYVLIVEKYHVIKMVEREKVLYIQNDLLISEEDQGLYFNFNYLQHKVLVDLGMITKFSQLLCAGYIYDNELVSLCYINKELKIKTLSIEQNQQHRPKKLSNSISRIMERSNEEGSQFQSNMPRPIIRDIHVENQIADDQLKSQNSQILSRSGMDIKKHDDLFSINDIEKKDQRSSKAREQFLIMNGEISQISGEGEQSLHKKISDDSSLKQSDQKKSFKVKRRATDLGAKHNYYNQKFKDSFKKSDNSQSNDHSIEELMETPGFGMEGGFGGDAWGAYHNNWQASQKVEEVAENSEVDNQPELQKSQLVGNSFIEKSYILEESKKVKQFKSPGVKLTMELVNEIEGATYVKLMGQMHRKDIDRFAQLLQTFLWQIVCQSNCQVFLAEHLPAFSPSSTQDKLKRLFRPHQQKQNFKSKVTQALKQFKLNEVPSQFLQISQEIIRILMIVYPQIYIIDIVEPNISIVEKVMEKYLIIEQFPQQIIYLEGEQINLAHPRNFLNILLYMNETFEFAIGDIIKIYCEQMIKENHFEIIRKLIEQNVFQICEVPIDMLNQIIMDRFNEMLRDSVDNADYLWDLVCFLNGELLQQYEMKLAIVQELNKHNLYFNVEYILTITDPQTNVYIFLEELITDNSSESLRKLKLANIYRSLYWLQEKQKLNFCTNEYLDLIKSYAQKIFGDGYLYEGLANLQFIFPRLKKSFLAKLLVQYLDCKMLNRISGTNMKSLPLIFPQIFTEQLEISQIEHQTFSSPSYSDYFACSWEKFIDLLKQYVNGPPQLFLFVYVDLPSAQELFFSLEQEKKKGFSRFLIAINECLVDNLQDNKMMGDQTINPKGMTNIMLLSKQEMLQTEKGSSMLRNEEYLESQGSDLKNKKAFKSMTLIDHFMKIRKMSRANSQKQYQSGVSGTSQLYRLKILVHEDQILQTLKQIYEHQPRSHFLKALTLIDLQKISLYHLDSYKLLVAKDIQFKFQSIIPFNIFTISSRDECYESIKRKIQTQLTIDNFWLMRSIIELFFGKGSDLSGLFLKKFLLYYQNDQTVLGLEQLLRDAKNIPSSQMNACLKIAQEQNMHSVYKCLIKYL